MEGGIEIEVFEKLVGDPMLLNIICKANKNKNKYRSWALYLKNWASYSDYRESENIQISKSHSIFEIRL